jgi:hypothetical protein
MGVLGRLICTRRVCAAMTVCASLAVSACGGPNLTEDQDPLARASSISTLPSNVGPADCRPPSPAEQIDLGLEVHGTGDRSDVWVLFESAEPLRSGQSIRAWWHVAGSHELELVLVGSDREIPVGDARPDPTLPWNRPGDQWLSTVNFPQPGCWRISVTRGDAHGDVWVQVS